MKVLFESPGRPHSSIYISYCMAMRREPYSQAVQEIIESTEKSIDFNIFSMNAAKMMAASKMNQRGPFQGILIIRDKIYDPEGMLCEIWDSIGKPVCELKSILINSPKQDRQRLLVDMQEHKFENVADGLWNIFKGLIPFCMGVDTLGLTAASKLLFSVFPEIALPVEKIQWKKLFQTIDFADVLRLIRKEISEWERSSGHALTELDSSNSATLPEIYNAVALRVFRNPSATSA
jgi:hypothetical protein